MKTEEQIFAETRADLAGENGPLARRATLRGLMNLNAQITMDQLHVLGRKGTKVMKAGNSVMISSIKRL